MKYTIKSVVETGKQLTVNVDYSSGKEVIKSEELTIDGNLTENEMRNVFEGQMERIEAESSAKGILEELIGKPQEIRVTEIEEEL